MSGPYEVLTRAILLLLAPTMMVLPAILALCVPNQATATSQRGLARTKMAGLILMTGLALAVWMSLLLVSLQLPAGNALSKFTHFTCFLFFPLWFGFAMPAIRAKNSTWSGTYPASAAGAHAATFADNDTVRTASLANRERENPIKPWYWVVAGIVTIGCMLAIASRGLFLVADPESVSPNRGDWMQWMLATVIYGTCLLINWITLPIAMRASHLEPEPLDTRGSQELIELYRAHRQRKARGLFWLIGVIVPTFVGLIITCVVWWPEGSRYLGLIGGIGGSILGFAGAVFGILMGFQRMRIAEVKANLDRAGGLSASVRDSN